MTTPTRTWHDARRGYSPATQPTKALEQPRSFAAPTTELTFEADSERNHGPGFDRNSFRLASSYRDYFPDETEHTDWVQGVSEAAFRMDSSPSGPTQGIETRGADPDEEGIEPGSWQTGSNDGARSPYLQGPSNGIPQVIVRKGNNAVDGYTNAIIRSLVNPHRSPRHMFHALCLEAWPGLATAANACHSGTATPEQMSMIDEAGRKTAKQWKSAQQTIMRFTGEQSLRSSDNANVFKAHYGPERALKTDDDLQRRIKYEKRTSGRASEAGKYTQSIVTSLVRTSLNRQWSPCASDDADRDFLDLEENESSKTDSRPRVSRD